MARKQYPRVLPPLPVVLADFPGFGREDNKSVLVVQWLRTAIERTRQEQPVVFYSVREVANFFGIALKTAVESFEKLEAEGLVTRVRGSHTLLEGRRQQPRHPIRGVVGVPVYLPALVYGNDWRAFLMDLEEHLRRYHFVCDFVFYHARDQRDETLKERLLDHDLDMVFWYVPIPEHVPTMLRLLDGGVKLVVVSDGKGQFPCEQYYLDLDVGAHDAMKNWAAQGVRSCVILKSPRHPSRHSHAVVERAIRAAGLPWEVWELEDAEVPGAIQRLVRQRRQGVIFTSYPWGETLCAKFPPRMEKLFVTCRVFLAQGAVYCPAFEGRYVPADTIELPNAAMAQRVAADISTGAVWEGGRLATFEVHYRPRINLGRVTRDVW